MGRIVYMTMVKAMATRNHLITVLLECGDPLWVAVFTTYLVMERNAFLQVSVNTLKRIKSILKRKKEKIKIWRSYPMIPAQYPNLQGIKDCTKKTPLTWDSIHNDKETIDKMAWVNNSKYRGFLTSCTINILLVIWRFNNSPAEVMTTLMTFCHDLILWASVGNCGSSLLPSIVL